MNRIFLALLSFAGLACVSANAQNITCGTTISSQGTYTLASDQDNSGRSAPCIDVSGVNATHALGVVIDCQGHSISESGGNPPPLLSVHGGTTDVEVKNCHFSEPASTYAGLAWPGISVAGVSSGSSYLGGLYIHDSTLSYTDIVANNCGAADLSIFSNTLTNSVVTANNCPSPYISYNSFDYSAYAGYTSYAPFQLMMVTSSDNADIQNNTMAANYLTADAVIHIRKSNNPNITWNTIVTGAAPDGTGHCCGTDDGIVVEADKYGSTAYTGFAVEYNTVSKGGYDACIETVGRWTYSTLKNNNCTNPGLFAYSSYHNTAFDHVTISGNTMTRGSGFNYGALMGWSDNVDIISSPADYFTNVTISGNSVSGTSPGSSAPKGWIGTDWSGYYNFANYSAEFDTNYFDTQLLFQSSQTYTGTTDSGGNHCPSTSPASVLSCIWP